MSRSFHGLAALLGVTVTTACSDSGSSDFAQAGGSAGTLNLGNGGNAGSSIINVGDASLGLQDDAGPSGPSPVVPCNGPCTDFPAAPIVAGADAGAMGDLPGDIAGRF